MRLSWNEIRARAAAFAEEWRDAAYEKGETQSFYNEFFQVFGVLRRTVARYEEHVKRLDNTHGYIDLFWPGVLLVEQKSAGRDLDRAYDQAGAYFDALPEHDRPRYILLSDFQTFELHDLDEREAVTFPLTDLPGHVEAFGFILGVQKRVFRDQDPVNIAASELVGRLHDALAEAGYQGHDLERFLVRIVFCLFADDTGVFEPRDIFLDLLENRTTEDGSDTGSRLAELFQVLEHPGRGAPKDARRGPRPVPLRERRSVRGAVAHSRRSTLPCARPCWMFAGSTGRTSLRPSSARCSSRSWSLRSAGPRGPTTRPRRTSSRSSSRCSSTTCVSEFARLKARKDSRRVAELRRFQEKLGRMTCFDPACGCGNFLIIAYRELRELEIAAMKEIHPHGQLDVLAETLSVIDVDQFYGIEIGEFPARIAETALWMMDHIMNNRLSLEFGQTYARIPSAKRLLTSSSRGRAGDRLAQNC